MSNGWTQERRARQSDLMKAMRPWEKSTGPKSPDGKIRSSRNAWKGGCRAALRAVTHALKGQREALRVLRDGQSVHGEAK